MRGNEWLRKLSADQVEEIRKSPMQATVLAKHYGVARKTIWSIRNGQTYRSEPEQK